VTWLNRLQVRLAQVVGLVLGLFDTAFDTQIGERTVDWLTARWRRRLDDLNAELEALEAERQGLEAQASALALQAAVYYLGARVVSRGEVCFDPNDPDEEQMLDATIELLVKPRLATIETLESSEGRYRYRIEPDWGAIRGHLEKLAPDAGSETAAWLQECLTFIDQISESLED
jgi:hypothetical protein